MSIGDVSHSVGYDDPLTFSKQFKKSVGVSPSAYRESL
ncbi:MAG: AraC family transcriptional regulator [Clostridia bacterium]|nr:AraC family transcriptional regulator [Clostridia bacterium]